MPAYQKRENKCLHFDLPSKISIKDDKISILLQICNTQISYSIKENQFKISNEFINVHTKPANN